MSKLTIELPDSLHEELLHLTSQGNITLDEYVMSAIVEKVALLRSIEALKARGKAANFAELRQILNQVPTGLPDDYDRL